MMNTHPSVLPCDVPPVVYDTSSPHSRSRDIDEHCRESCPPLATVQSRSTNSSSPAPLLSMQYSRPASSSSCSRATCSEEASSRVTQAPSHALLFRGGDAQFLGSQSHGSRDPSDAPSARVTDAEAMPHLSPAAVMGVSSPGCGSPTQTQVLLASGCVQHCASAAHTAEADEIHSCMTVSSTASSPGVSLVPVPVQSPALCVVPPQHQSRVPLTLSSSEGRCGFSASAPRAKEEPAPPLPCSSFLTPPAVGREAPGFTLSSGSPAPSKPSSGPLAAGATVVCSGVGRGEAHTGAPRRPYSLLDSELSGGPVDGVCTTSGASATRTPEGCSMHPTEPCGLSPAAEKHDSSVAENVAPESQPATSTASTEEPVLSAEQQYAFHTAVRDQRSVFITGGAGTGKSHLLRTIIRALPPSSTFVTATTGIAALNLSGSTLHSFVGCGIPSTTSTRDSLVSTVFSKQRCVRSWRICRTLIIDEVSMLEPSFFDLIDYIARQVRHRPEEPFGGIQLILSGDFLQLPPVSRERRGSTPQFCFEAESWLGVNPQICLLTTPFRQRNLRFFSILNEMRFGELRPESVELLYSLDTTERVHFVRRCDTVPAAKAGENDASSKVGQPDLKREAVVSAGTSSHGTNACKRERPSTGGWQGRLELVDGLGRVIDAPFDGYTILRSTRAEVDAENQKYYRQLKTEIFMYRGFHTGKGDFPEGTLAKVVHLRKGCRVMLIKNFDPRLGLVNGSTGTVTDFVAVSRAYFFKTTGINANDARAVCVGRGANINQSHMMLPVVAFDLRAADGSIVTREIVVEPQEWKEMLGTREVSRSVQIPLILAYAITIHKSQGMSLTQVDIDFTNVFECGQSYVALSRCTDMEYVRLHGFDAHRVSTNPTALAYYKALALQQQRLQWLRYHVPQVAAAAAASEVFSCTPYGYVLPPAGQVCFVAGEPKPTSDTILRNDSTSTTSKSSSCSSSSSSVERDYLELETTEGHRPFSRNEGERQGGCDLGCTRKRQRRRSQHRPLGARVKSLTHGAASLSPQTNVALGEKPNENGDADFDGVNETVRLDRLRRRITPLLTTASMVGRLVTRKAIPLHQVYNTRIVVDVHALFQLVSGPESATAFDVLFGERDNMMRVPLSVYTLVTEAAAYRSTSESLSQSASSHYSASGLGRSRKEASVRSDTFGANRCGLQREPFDAPLLSASDVAAEALAVMERAKQDFFLDVQRPDQVCSLPEPDSSWLRFTEVLPLLQRWRGGSNVKDGAMGDAVKGFDDDDACREVDFILNRDPRENLQHHAILEYALFLKATFGQDVVICTDCFSLAAYALAWRLRVVSTDRLCSSNSGSDGLIV